LYRIVEPEVKAAELAAARASGQFSPRELYALEAGMATLHQRRGRLRLVPVVSGGALGTGAVYEKNLPPPGTFVINPLEFARRTSKNRKSNAPLTWPGYGSTLSQRIDAVGLVSKLFIYMEVVATGDGTTPTALRGHPWNLVRRLRVSANGINNLFSCEGLDLRALMHVRRPYPFTDRMSAFVLPVTSGTSTYKLMFEVPLAYDASLVGAIFAQTEDTFLNVEIDTPASADLYSANPPAIAGTVRIGVEYFSLPLVDSKAGRVLALPDITQLHGVSTTDPILTGAGDHVAQLTRTGGTLLRALQRIDNTDVGSFDLDADVDSHYFRYGGNVVPINYSPSEFSLYETNLDTGDMVLPTNDALANLVPAYFVDDFVRESSLRDAVQMAGITEAQLVNTIRTGATVNAGAKVHTVQESMVAS